MASVYSAGSASVQIVPDFSNAQRKIGQWFAQQNDMKVSVRPDLDNAAMAGVRAQVAAHKPTMHIDIDRKTLAKDFVSAIDFVTGTSMVGNALAKLFDVKPILMANLGGAGVALGSSIGQALTTAVGGAAAMLPALVSAAAIPIGTAVLGSQGIGDAFKALGGTTEADAKKLVAAMKDLAPAARDFVTQVHSLAPAFKDLRLDVQEHLFSGLGDSVKNLGQKMLPMLRGHLTGIADEIGGMGKALAEAMSTDGNVADFAHTIDNVKAALHNVAQAIKPVWQAFADLATVGSDFLPGLTQGLGGLAQKFADFIRSARESGALHDFMARAFDGIKQLWGIVKDLGGGLKSIFQAALPYGETLLQIIGLVASDLNDFLGTDVAQSGLDTFFQGITDTLGALTPGLMALVEALVTAVLPAMSGFAAAVAPIINTVLVDFADLLKDLAPLFYPALAGAISSALSALAPLIDVFGEIVKSVLPPVIDLVNRLAPLFSELAEGIGDALVGAIRAVAPMLPPLVDAIVAIAEAMVPMIVDLAELAVDIMPPLVAVLTAFAKVLEWVAPILPAVALGFVAMKVAGGLAGMISALSWALARMGQNAAFASYSMSGFAGATAGRASTGLTMLARGVGTLAAALPIVGAALAAVTIAYQHGQEEADGYATAMMKGGQATRDAYAEAGKGGVIEAIAGKIGGLGEILKLWTSNTEEAEEAQRKLWNAMTPLEQAQSKQAYWTNELAWRQKDGNATSAEVEAAKRRLAWWSGEVTIQEEKQADATKTATQRLKEQQDQILEAANAQIAYERSQLRVNESIANYTAVQNDSTKSAHEKKTAELDVRDAVLSAADAAKRKAEEDNKGKSVSEISKLANDAYLQTMKDLTAQLDGPAKDALLGIIAGMEATSTKADLVKAAMSDLGLTIEGVPNEKFVEVKAPTAEQEQRLKDLGYRVEHLPNGNIIVSADTDPAEDAIRAMIQQKRIAYVEVRATGRDLNGDVSGSGRMGTYGAIGGVIKGYAQGGIELTPMAGNIAQIVPPNTWRVIGDRVRDDEAYIPINDAPRSVAILGFTADQMGFSLIPNADGGYWTPPGLGSAFSALGRSGSAVVAAERDALGRSQVRSVPQVPSSVAGFVNNGTVVTTDLDELSRKARLGTRRALAVAGL